MQKNEPYTPKSISENNTIQFSIPLYQRLFEWGKEQIEQLLNDVKSAYEKDASKAYYIGMLTSYQKKNQNSKELVDGQQRFTVLMLLGICLKWDSFLKTGDKPRLTFFARSNDEEYLKKLIGIKMESDTDYKNKKMENAIALINDFLEKITFKDTTKKIDGFKKYIFEKLTFFISELPNDYNPQDLNRYFEAMNATGKGLENHEILKVTLLKKLTDNKELYTKIWNAVSQMDKPLIMQKKGETAYDLGKRQSKANSLIVDPNAEFMKIFENCNDSNETIKNPEIKTIRAIEKIGKSPEKQSRSNGERSILTFPEFLLQI